MSRVYFHTRENAGNPAELDGAEFEWLRSIARGSVKSMWRIDRNTTDLHRARQIIELIPAGDPQLGYLHEHLAAAESGGQRTPWGSPRLRLMTALETAIATGMNIEVAGIKLNTRDIESNTVLMYGVPQMALAAKITGWLSPPLGYVWFDGPDRAWAAEIMQTGVDRGYYRDGFWYDTPGGQRTWRDTGWEACIARLLSSAKTPLVLSYSTNCWFPSFEISTAWPQGWPTDHTKLTFSQQCDLERLELDWHIHNGDGCWDDALAGLKQQRPWAQITPDNLLTTSFTYPVTIADLFARNRDERVGAAVAAIEGP